MHPASLQSVVFLLFSHSQAKYFSVGKLKQDQVQDYAKRKAWKSRLMVRGVGFPQLGMTYDPDKV
ncbi:MAG: vitamin B12 dependent-methionine synthase activation domain-containing protein [Nitrospirales bacterium]